ncbi:hypothetical protein [Micromonospora chersina]|uniref:hypothetical protein n=1 Tax=Micromonospora chersina TaxID=47854 RepID=UPI0033D31FA3
MRGRPAERPGARSPWFPLLIGSATGGGLHTLLIAILGISPQRGDDPDQWSLYLIFVSAVPVFVMVIVGLVLAPLGGRLAPLGIGLVVGAVASPLLWLVAGSAQHSG